MTTLPGTAPGRAVRAPTSSSTSPTSSSAAATAALGLTTGVLDERELLAQHSPADVAAGVGPRARRQLRGALAAARGRRHRGDAARARRHLRRVRAPARRPADPAAAAARPRPATTSAWCAARCSTPSTRSASTPARALLDARLRLRHGRSSTSTSTTRRCWPPTSCAAATPVLPADRRAARARGADRAPPRCWSPPARSRWARRPTPGPTTTSGPRTRSTCAAYCIDTVPVSNAAYRAFVEAGGYDDERLVEPRPAGAGAASPASASPAFWLREGGTVAAPPVRPASSRCPTTSRCSTSAGSRPTPTPAGPAGGCRPRPSGRRPRPGTRRPAPSAATRGATTAPTDEHANLGQTRYQPGRRPGRSPPAPSPSGVAADGRRRVGVDLERVHRLPRASGRSPTGSTPRCSSTTATRCCAAARGPPTRWPAAPRSATGTTRSAGRSSPASATAPGRLMCRHLAYLGAPAHPARRWSRPAALALRAVLGAAAAAARHGQRRRLRRRLVRRPAPSPVRYRRAQPIWTDASFASLAPTIADVLRGGRGPLRDRRHVRRRGGRRAVHPRALAVQPQRPAARLGHRPQGAAAAGGRRARTPGSASTPRCCSAWPSPAGRPARRWPPALAGAARDVLGARRRPADHAGLRRQRGRRRRRRRAAARAGRRPTAPSSPPSRTTTTRLARARRR